jgi:hypothetical protein
MVDWRYSSTILDLRTRWRRMVSFMFLRAPSTHWIGSWVDPRARLDVIEKKQIYYPYREYNPGVQAIT